MPAHKKPTQNKKSGSVKETKEATERVEEEKGNGIFD